MLYYRLNRIPYTYAVKFTEPHSHQMCTLKLPRQSEERKGIAQRMKVCVCIVYTSFYYPSTLQKMLFKLYPNMQAWRTPEYTFIHTHTQTRKRKHNPNTIRSDHTNISIKGKNLHLTTKKEVLRVSLSFSHFFKQFCRHRHHRRRAP